MAELARGSLADRPWGRTLGALALRGVTGQVTLAADGKRFAIAFVQGAVAGAVSPLASDAAVRVAMTAGLISSTQVAEIARRQAAAPQHDEVDLVCELARLPPDHAMRLRRRVNAQRAARTFSPDRGDFVITDQVGIPTSPGAELDVRAVIYLGARANLADARLEAELAQMGSWFVLKAAAVPDLPQFGFGEAERPLVEILSVGASVADLVQANHGLDPRGVRAVLYALASCNALDVDPSSWSSGVAAVRPPPRAPVPAAPPPRPSPPVQQAAPAPQPPRPVQSVQQLPRPPQAPPQAPRPNQVQQLPHPSQLGPRAPGPPMPQQPVRAISAAAAQPRERYSSDGLDAPTIRKAMLDAPMQPPRAVGLDAPTVRHPGANAAAPRRPRNRTGPKSAEQIVALIHARLAMLDQGVDHYTLLGIQKTAAPKDIETAYLALAKQLHPDKLKALGVEDAARDAHRLFAQVNSAVAVLRDPTRRADYLAVLSRGGENAVRAEQAKADEMAMRVLDAEEAFRRGEMAMRRDQLGTAIEELRRAIELNPDEADYHAMLAWAQFCASSDKMVAAPSTRSTLDRAIRQSPNATTARLLLGRMERMLGRDQDALRHFHAVLEIDPHNSDATSEVRVLEQRQRKR